MDFLKRHLFFILCGVGAAGGIALGVTGMQAMPKVKTELESAAGVYKSLEGVKPINAKSIEGEDKRIQAILDDYKKILSQADNLYSYVEGGQPKPLVDGVFPDGPPEKRVEFRNKYNEAMRELYASLQCGGPATQVQVDQARDRIENEAAAAKQFGAEPADGGPTHTPADVLTRAGVRQDPNARAAIAAAQGTLCYAVNFFDDKPPDRVMSLEFNNAMKDTTSLDAPEDEACWKAQVSYWIQKDVVEAINSLNQAAAEAAKAADQSRWVGNMPVKEVISVRTSNYVPEKDELYKGPDPVGYTAALPPGTAESVFTGTRPTDAYDVIQFTLKLVMDVRDIPLLIEELSDNSPHTVVRVSYKSVPLNKNFTGKVYGSEPTVLVVLDFESVMLGEIFRPLIPDAVCENYKIKCPNRDGEEKKKDDKKDDK